MHDVDYARRVDPFPKEISQNLTALCGVSSLGLMTMVLPVTSAGAAFLAMRKNGKFQGRIPPITPIGWRNSRMVSPARSLSRNLALDAPCPFRHIVEVVRRERNLDASET